MRCQRDHETDTIFIFKEDNMFLGKVSRHLPDKQKSTVAFIKNRRVRLRYSLISEPRGGIIFYGIEIDSFSDDSEVHERVLLSELTSDRELCVRILRAMYSGTVTPCSASCVADDMLAQSVLRECVEGT